MSAPVRKVIEEIADGFRRGDYDDELTVSQRIVVPVLHALGWPVWLPRAVQARFPVQNDEVMAYALCDAGGAPAVLVDVRRDLSSEGAISEGVTGYVRENGVQFVVLTDGRAWSLFLGSGVGGAPGRLANLDLVGENRRVTSRTLGRYLGFGSVRSGLALRTALADYQAVVEREVARMFPSAWRSLLLEPPPALVAVLGDAVEREAGIRPAAERVTDFIRRQAGSRKRTLHSREATLGRSRMGPAPTPLFSYTLDGRESEFGSGKELLIAIFRELARRDSTFCERYADRFAGKKQRYLARRREDLFPNSSNWEEMDATALVPGWWINTHMSSVQKESRVREACEIAGIGFGEELIVRFPVRSRQPWAADSAGSVIEAEKGWREQSESPVRSAGPPPHP